MIELYTAPTPNGYKISVTLEELAMPYNVHAVDLKTGAQKQPDFLKINPNGRVPAIIDRACDNLRVFESGAIMIYLAEKANRLLPTKAKPRAEVLSWLMFQMGGIGPMMGQATIFYRYFPDKIQPAIDRYQNETRRLFGVLDRHLADHEWLGDDFSIADIANWCWTRQAFWAGVGDEDFTHLQAWHARMEARPKCKAGVQVPYPVREKMQAGGEKVETIIKNIQPIIQK